MTFTGKQLSASHALADTLTPFFNEIKRLVDHIWELIDSISDLPPRQRYELVRKLGPAIYLVFFQRKGTYHCRNNC